MLSAKFSRSRADLTSTIFQGMCDDFTEVEDECFEGGSMLWSVRLIGPVKLSNSHELAREHLHYTEKIQSL